MSIQRDGEPPPRVFVTYSHDSAEHKELVRQFCTFLRRDEGIDVHLDLWYDGEQRDWPKWAIDQIRAADFIMPIASPAYKRRVDGLAPSGEGRGSIFEASLVLNDLTRNLHEEARRILPVVLPGRSVDEFPSFLRAYAVTHFVITEITHAGVESLLAAFSQVAKYPMPERGRFAGNPYAELHARLQAEEISATANQAAGATQYARTGVTIHAQTVKSVFNDPVHIARDLNIS